MTAKGRVLVLFFVMGALRPIPSAAQNTCGLFVSIALEAAHLFALPGDIVRVRVTLGAGVVQGGTGATISRVRYELDCSVDGALGLGCMDDGAVVEYGGDGTITTDCPNSPGGNAVSFSTGHPIGTTPNQVVFTASTPFFIPRNTSAYCSLEFDVRVVGLSNDSTPQNAEMVSGYSASAQDARCDNGLSSAGSQSASIELCPLCDDNACPSFVCNQETGACEPLGDQDADGEADATDRCAETPPGEPVDDGGCSIAQFCARFDDAVPPRLCRKADWGNDEPLMRSDDADCRLDRASKRCRPAAP